MSDRKWLEEIIHDHFKECGKSGCFFDKKQTISSLIEFTEDRRIDIYNFEYTHIDNESLRIAAKANPLSHMKKSKKQDDSQ